MTSSSACTDEDSDSLTFTATGLPAGLSISSAGVITGTIDRSASQTGGGVYTVEVTAADGDGATATDSFTWTISNPAPIAVADTGPPSPKKARSTSTPSTTTPTTTR